MNRRVNALGCSAFRLGQAVPLLPRSSRSGYFATFFRGRPATALNRLLLAKKKPRQAVGLGQRLCFSLALRSTAAPGRWGRVGTGFARAASARVLRQQNAEGLAPVVREGLVRSCAKPNPSIEGTSCQPLRVCQAAPHVKR